MYNYICESCGAHLDPGERCDCKKEAKEKKMRYLSMFSIERQTGQYRLEVGNGKFSRI